MYITPRFSFLIANREEADLARRSTNFLLVIEEEETKRTRGGCTRGELPPRDQNEKRLRDGGLYRWCVPSLSPLLHSPLRAILPPIRRSRNPFLRRP